MKLKCCVVVWSTLYMSNPHYNKHVVEFVYTIMMLSMLSLSWHDDVWYIHVWDFPFAKKAISSVQPTLVGLKKIIPRSQLTVLPCICVYLYCLWWIGNSFMFLVSVYVCVCTLTWYFKSQGILSIWSSEPTDCPCFLSVIKVILVCRYSRCLPTHCH